MAVPSTRAEFKAWCLRRLGAPVIEINVDDDQVEDRIDEALRYFMDYHFDGSEKTYYSHQLTQTDIDNKYITVPSNVFGVVKLFPPSTYYGVANMFNIRYQIALNDMYTLTSQSIAPYYMVMEHLQFLEQILVGQIPIRFNRITNKLYLDMDKHKLLEGQYILVEAYQIVDPTTYGEIWGDPWLGRYAATLVKMQWGSNLKKFKGLQLPGGVQFSGQEIFDEAKYEIEKLEEEMLRMYAYPPEDQVG